jgi:hypothetical protein
MTEVLRVQSITTTLPLQVSTFNSATQRKSTMKTFSVSMLTLVAGVTAFTCDDGYSGYCCYQGTSGGGTLAVARKHHCHRIFDVLANQIQVRARNLCLEDTPVPVAIHCAATALLLLTISSHSDAESLLLHVWERHWVATKNNTFSVSGCEAPS